MNRTFRNRVCKESIDTIIDTFHSFVCMLTDEQLIRWHESCLVTIKALREIEPTDVEQVEQFIREEVFKRDIIEDVCLKRRITLAYCN